MPYLPTLDISVRFDAAAEIVWAALTRPEVAREWWPSLELEPVLGGSFAVVTPREQKKRPRTAAGALIGVDDGQELVARIRSEPRGFDSTVTLTVSQLKHRSKLRVVEAGLLDGQPAAIVAAECRDGWREVLGALDDFLDEPGNVDRIRRRLG